MRGRFLYREKKRSYEEYEEMRKMKIMKKKKKWLVIVGKK